METKTSSLGQKIKRYRLVNDIRQEDMAEKLGVSRATLINYEKGHTSINIDVLNKLRNFYPDFSSDSKNPIKPRIIDENTIDFKILFKVLIDSKNYIFFLTFLFCFAGTGSSFLFKKYYNADISLYPAKNDYSQGIGQFQSLAANFGIKTANNDQKFNIPDVVNSRLIANKAINEEWETKNGEPVTLLELWSINNTRSFFLFNKSNIDTSVIIENAIKKFEEHIEVTEDKITGLIKISTTFQDPYIAANVANFIGDQVESYIQKENSAQSTKEKIFIFDRLTIVKKELEDSELELKAFKERNRGYEDSPELFMKFSQFFREVEAKKEVYLTLQQQLELARIEEVKQSPILHVLDYAVPPTKKSYPKRTTFLIVSLFLGFIVSSIQVIFRY
tara:strand:+ start:44738 stop:45907 length:1170 start_codon:yes stop_codon:yes gene_type:complete